VAIVVVAGAACLYGVTRVTAFALSADALTISRITVDGTHRMAPGEVLALLDDLRGTNMMTVDLESWRQKLLDAPWVEDATVRRAFPGTVAVRISEREPLGIARIRNVLYLIDERGAIIDEFGPKYADFDLPIIDGLDGSGGSADERAALAGRVLADFQGRPSMARAVSQVDVSSVRDAVVILKDDDVLIHTGDGHFVDRVQTYLDFQERMRETVPEIHSVDVRIDGRVFVTGRGTADR
jgi:cell division protein FtsQ